MKDCGTSFEMGSPQSKCRLRDLKAATGFAKCNLSVKQSVSYGFTGYLIFKQLRVLVIGIQNVGTVEKKQEIIQEVKLSSSNIVTLSDLE